MPNYEKIFTSHPINRVADRVTNQRDQEYYDVVLTDKTKSHWDCPPNELLQNVPINAENLIGRTFGRLTVFGYVGKLNKNQPHTLWLVKCSCGSYEMRKTKSIKNPENKFDCCHKCGRQRAMINKEQYHATGKIKAIES